MNCDKSKVMVLSRLLAVFLLMLLGLPQSEGEILHHRRQTLVVAYFVQPDRGSNAPYYLQKLAMSGKVNFLDQLNFSSASVTGGRCSISDPTAALETAYSSRNSIDGTGDNLASPFRGYLHQLKELKHRYPKLKILISLEGSAASFREDAKPEHLREFVTSCVDIFLRGHFAPGIAEPGIFDGIDVNWEFPQRQDAGNFRALIRELRHQMNAVHRGFTLAVAVGDQPEMQPGTDFRKIYPLVDEIGIMNYDYAGPWQSTTGFLAPLFRTADAPQESGSVAESIAAYKSAGIPARKLLMGIPFYGYEWRGVTPANHGLFQKGRAVSEDKSYREIRDLQTSYSFHRSSKSRAPWLFNGASFLTFEDSISVEYKCKYAALQHLGGIMIWELGQDTAEGTLLTAASRSLRHHSTTQTGMEGGF